MIPQIPSNVNIGEEGNKSVYSAEVYPSDNGSGVLLDYSDNIKDETLNLGETPPIVLSAPLRPERTDDDYKAEAKSNIYEIVSKNGVLDSLDVELEIFQTGQGKKKSGHGKANIVIGKDLKERRFEVPIILKSDKFTFGKVKDMDSGDNVELGDASLFDGPDSGRQWDLMEKEYESDGYGKKPDDDVKRMKLVFASADDGEVQSFINGKAEENKLEKMSKYRKIGGLAAIGTLGALMLYLHFRTRDSTTDKTEYNAEEEIYSAYKKLRGYDD